MEEEEEPDDPEGGWRICVEAKTFYCLPSKDGFVLRESHRRWEREMTLSLEQVSWISKGLLARCQCFGGSKRKEIRIVEGLNIALIEGSNHKGCFLSIQIKQGSQEPRFLVVPAGNNGVEWGRVSRLISCAIEGSTQVNKSGSPPPPMAMSNSCLVGGSFADIVRGKVLDPYVQNFQQQLQMLLQEINTLADEMRGIYRSKLESEAEGFTTEMSNSVVETKEDTEIKGCTFAADDSIGLCPCLEVSLAPAVRYLSVEELRGFPAGDNAGYTSSVQEGDAVVSSPVSLRREDTVVIGSIKSPDCQEDDDKGNVDCSIQISNLDQNPIASVKITADSQLSASRACFGKEGNVGSGCPQKTASVSLVLPTILPLVKGQTHSSVDVVDKTKDGPVLKYSNALSHGVNQSPAAIIERQEVLGSNMEACGADVGHVGVDHWNIDRECLSGESILNFKGGPLVDKSQFSHVLSQGSHVPAVKETNKAKEDGAQELLSESCDIRFSTSKIITSVCDPVAAERSQSDDNENPMHGLGTVEYCSQGGPTLVTTPAENQFPGCLSGTGSTIDRMGTCNDAGTHVQASRGTDSSEVVDGSVGLVLSEPNTLARDDSFVPREASHLTVGGKRAAGQCMGMNNQWCRRKKGYGSGQWPMRLSHKRLFVGFKGWENRRLSHQSTSPLKLKENLIGSLNEGSRAATSTNEESEDSGRTTKSCSKPPKTHTFLSFKDPEKKELIDFNRWPDGLPDDPPEGISRGYTLIIDGEAINGWTILKTLLPPLSVRQSDESFALWETQVGDPLVAKILAAKAVDDET